MNLVIDFGNTLKKIAIFEGNELIKFFVYKKFNLSHLKKIAEKYSDINSAIISSVVDYPLNIDDYLKENFYFIHLDQKTLLPVCNKYKSPSTLGYDRIAAVVAATKKFPDKNILVINAGSCITFDFINMGMEYLGGSIAPGIMQRLKALNSFTDKLPLVKPKKIKFLIGENTQQSILSGVINGVIAEIDGIIDLYKDTYKNLTIIMSGGDYKYFDKRLKNNIFAFSNIVMLGLNIILDFNESQKK